MLILLGLICLAVSHTSLQAQSLVQEFRPKVKGTPHRAAHLVQEDGKIVMIGDYAFVDDTPVPNVLRFNSDGSILLVRNYSVTIVRM